MTLAKLITTIRLHRLRSDLERNLSRRKLARSIRAEAADRGQSTYWRRAGERHRAMFGGGANG